MQTKTHHCLKKSTNKSKTKNQTTILKTKNNKRKTIQNIKTIPEYIYMWLLSFSFFPVLFFRSWPGDQDVKHLRKKHNKREKRVNKKRQEGNICKKRANKQQPHINVLYIGFSFGFVFMLLLVLFAFFLFFVAFSCAVLIVFCSKSGLDWVFCFSLILFSFLFVLWFYHFIEVACKPQPNLRRTVALGTRFSVYMRFSIYLYETHHVVQIWKWDFKTAKNNSWPPLHSRMLLTHHQGWSFWFFLLLKVWPFWCLFWNC